MPSRRKTDYKQHGDKFVYVSPNFQKQFSIKDDVVEAIIEVPIENDDKIKIKIDVPLKESKKSKKEKYSVKGNSIVLNTNETVTDDHD